jgi:hypothetical protein
MGVEALGLGVRRWGNNVYISHQRARLENFEIALVRRKLLR